MGYAEDWKKAGKRGMWISPHKKPKARPPKPDGTLIKNGGDGNKSGHSGGHPLGKKKKNDRIKTQPPGTPQGVCNRERNPECACGKHYANKRN